MSRDTGAPTVLRTPTSFARLAERAVDKFIKLMHASNVMKAAMALKRYIY